MDSWIPNRTIDHVYRQKYRIYKERNRFQNNQYCKLQNIQNVITGCWICDFDKMLLSNSKNKRTIWIYRWTNWTTHWQPAQFRWVGRFPSTVRKFMTLVYWWPEPLDLTEFVSNRDPNLDLMWQSGTVAITTVNPSRGHCASSCLCLINELAVVSCGGLSEMIGVMEVVKCWVMWWVYRDDL
jgi:hypothetical protein